MKNVINTTYKNLIQNSSEFRAFVKKMDAYTSEEIDEQFWNNINAVYHQVEIRKKAT